MASYLELAYMQPRVVGRQRDRIHRPKRMSFEDIKKLHADHAELENDVEQLHQELSALGTSPDILALLERMKSAAARTKAHNDEIWQLVPALHRPSATSARVAEKVFDTAELLEEILTYLPLHQILDAMRVQRLWCDTIKGSVKLSRMLGLAPPSDGFFNCPFSCRSNKGASYSPTGLMNGLQLPRFMSFAKTDLREDWDPFTIQHLLASERVEWRKNTSLVDLSITCRPSLGRAPGARMAKIHICYPDISQLSFVIDCDCGASTGTSHSSNGGAIIQSNDATPKTVGELAARTNELLRTYGHVTNLCVDAQVTFYAEVKLSDTDPVTLYRRELIDLFEQYTLPNEPYVDEYPTAPDIVFERERGRYDNDARLCYNSAHETPVYVDDESEYATRDYEQVGAAKDAMNRAVVEEDEEKSEDGDDTWQRSAEIEWEAASGHFRKQYFPYDDKQ